MSPTISTKAKTQKRTMKSRASMEREKVIFYGVIIGGGVSLIVHLALQLFGTFTMQSRHDNEIKSLVALRALAVYEREEQYGYEIEIAESAAAGNVAEERRRQEWRRRHQLDPQYARTEMEKNMLEMREIGLSDMDNEEALEKIARLASPPRSGMKVTYVKRRGYKVQLAFPYTYVIDSHPEYRKYLPGLYHEVRRTTAGITSDILRFGKPKGAYQALIACQGEYTVSTRTGGKDRQLRDMYVTDATTRRADWSDKSRIEAEDASRVVQDHFPALLSSY